jgi:hypothetical protein
MASPRRENAGGSREMNRSFSILENAPDFVKGFQSGFLLGHVHFEKKRLVESHYFAEIDLPSQRLNSSFRSTFPEN